MINSSDKKWAENNKKKLEINLDRNQAEKCTGLNQTSLKKKGCVSWVQEAPHPAVGANVRDLGAHWLSETHRHWKSWQSSLPALSPSCQVDLKNIPQTPENAGF